MSREENEVGLFIGQNDEHLQDWLRVADGHFISKVNNDCLLLHRTDAAVTLIAV